MRRAGWNARYDFAGRDWAAEAGFRGLDIGPQDRSLFLKLGYGFQF